MKKFLALMCSVLVLCLSFAGCSDGWTEVQSITYFVGGETTTYTSTIFYDIEREIIDASEVPEGQQVENFQNFLLWSGPYCTQQVIPADRDAFFDSSQINTPERYFKASDSDETSVIKYSISAYQIQYITVKKISDRELEIKHYDDDKEVSVSVSTDSYEITYFED